MTYPLGLAFFGLGSEYRSAVFSQIHQIVFHGNGGYTWNDVYNMPIWLRKFTFQEIKDFYDKKNEAEEKAMKKARGLQKAKIHKPDINPSYKTKTSK